jgi:hypothetical protein
MLASAYARRILRLDDGRGRFRGTTLEALRGQDDWTASRELVSRARPQGIKVEFEPHREWDVDVIYVLVAR